MTNRQKALRIVIPAYKANATIQQCVRAIIDALYFHQSWEIVIVDNGDNHGLISLMSDCPVTVLKRDTIQSAAFARNEGAKGFSNGILIFIDSDVVCEAECIRNLITILEAKRCDAVIGNYTADVSGLGFAQKYKQLYVHYIYSRNDSAIRNDFWTAICAVDASAFHQTGGFNTGFKGANGEDQEFGIRLTQKGYVVQAAGNANGRHLHPYTFATVIRNDFRKGLTAVNNSLNHQVPFSDNRHARKRDMMAVVAAVAVLLLLLPAAFSSIGTIVLCMTATLWLVLRAGLAFTFLKAEDLYFGMRAILLMFILDLVRFFCVIVGFATFKYRKFGERNASNVLPIPMKS